MAAMEGVLGAQDQAQLQQQQQQQPPRVEKLNLAVQQQLNLESVKTRAIGLFKAISRILEDFDAIARTNAVPKWQDILGQFSMVNLELFNIVEDIKKVSKAFVVHPRNVNAENATILPVMLSSKLLPEMEAEDSTKREQLLIGMQNLPISAQIEKLKTRIDLIAAACESAEKVIADARKAYGLGTRQGPTIVPTIDKVQAAKIQEQENLLRAAANFGEGLRLPGEQRHIPSSLPMHLVDVLPAGDGAHITDASGMYPKNAPTSNSINSQGAIPQSLGRSVPSPSAATGATSFDNTTASPLPYANSPRSGTNMMNTPSPQQQAQAQAQAQAQQQQQQQQRQKMIQLLPHQQQLLAQQQFRQSSTPGLGQTQLPQLHDLQGQAQQKFQTVHGQHQMQFPQPLAHQQFQNRQLQSGHVQHSIGQSQLNQGNQLRNHLSQFTGAANSTLFNTAQTSPNSQMISNMPATMQSQLPRMQFGLSGGHAQRSHASQILSDPMFNMGVGNPSNMMPMQQQQQQHAVQGGFGTMQGNAQNLQPGTVALQNASQNPNFTQRQQGQQ